MRESCVQCIYGASSSSISHLPDMDNPSLPTYIYKVFCSWALKFVPNQGKAVPKRCPKKLGLEVPERLADVGHVSKYLQAKTLRRSRGKKRK